MRKTQAGLIQAGKLADLGERSVSLSYELNKLLAAAKSYANSAGLLIERARALEAQDNAHCISPLIDRMVSISRYLRNLPASPLSGWGRSACWMRSPMRWRSSRWKVQTSRLLPARLATHGDSLKPVYEKMQKYGLDRSFGYSTASEDM